MPEQQGDTDAGPAAVLRDWADEIRESERRRAERRLASQGDLTPAQRRTLASLSGALVDGVIGGAERTVREAHRRGDDELVDCVCELFDVDR